MIYIRMSEPADSRELPPCSSLSALRKGGPHIEYSGLETLQIQLLRERVEKSKPDLTVGVGLDRSVEEHHGMTIVIFRSSIVMLEVWSRPNVENLRSTKRLTLARIIPDRIGLS